jgi:hypothetical protein
MGRPAIRSLVGGAAGITAGVLGGIAFAAIPPGDAPMPNKAPVAIDGAHLPPLLVLPGEPVTLRYAIVCPPRDDGAPCDGAGEVYARAGQSGEFTRFVLQRGEDSKEGRYFVQVPPEIAHARGGFSYYAVLRDHSSGATITIPSGGAAAPQRSFLLSEPVDVKLGAHAFGRGRAPDARIVDAVWGSGVGEVGLSGSRELGLTGPSAFDVSQAGEVTVLDGVNARIERWSRGRVSATPIGDTALLSDLVVEPDGTLDVLEPSTRERPFPRLLSLRRDGSLKWTQRLSDRTWAKLAPGPDGPVVQQQPSEQWLPVAENGRPLDRSVQAHRGGPARPLTDGHGVVVQRLGASDLRVAETAGNAVAHAWRVSSATALGEVQLAEPVGNRLVVVVKSYDDDQDEFDVLVLDHTGLARKFAVPSAAWAESAPLARFRIGGSALYQLGSTPKGAFVDRFDLEEDSR